MALGQGHVRAVKALGFALGRQAGEDDGGLSCPRCADGLVYQRPRRAAVAQAALHPGKVRAGARGAREAAGVYVA